MGHRILPAGSLPFSCSPIPCGSLPLFLHRHGVDEFQYTCGTEQPRGRDSQKNQSERGLPVRVVSLPKNKDLPYSLFLSENGIRRIPKSLKEKQQKTRTLEPKPGFEVFPTLFDITKTEKPTTKREMHQMFRETTQNWPRTSEITGNACKLQIRPC